MEGRGRRVSVRAERIYESVSVGRGGGRGSFRGYPVYETLKCVDK